MNAEGSPSYVLNSEDSKPQAQLAQYMEDHSLHLKQLQQLRSSEVLQHLLGTYEAVLIGT